MDSGGDLSHHQQGGNAFASGDSNGGRSPLSMNLGFLKSLTEKKTTTRGELTDASTRYIYLHYQMDNPPSAEALNRTASQL